MNFLAKLGLFGLGAFALYKGVKATSAIMVANGMAINITPEIGVTGNGIKITTNIGISNPTDSSMSLTMPFVQLLHKSNLLSKNSVSSNTIEIKPFSDKNIPIDLYLTWTQITDLLDTLNITFPNNYNFIDKIAWIQRDYKKILNALGLVVKYSTYANGFNYSDQTTINI